MSNKHKAMGTIVRLSVLLYKTTYLFHKRTISHGICPISGCEIVTRPRNDCDTAAGRL